MFDDKPMSDNLVETIIAGELALTLRWGHSGLEGVDLDWAAGKEQTQPLTPRGRQFKTALNQYVQGQEPKWPEVHYEFDELTPFARDVLRTLRDNVGYGRTVSYGELAGMVGQPNAARAVGQIMARNPWPLVVPCHRVLGRSGKLTGFSGAGLEMKKYLLKLESGAA